jgi:hypothetical protein
MRFNEKYMDTWFFQDEWEEFGLLNILGYNQEYIKRNYPDGISDSDSHILFNKILFITEDEMEQQFFKTFDRPTTWWDKYQLEGINYMRLKQKYAKELDRARITSITCANMELPSVYSQWYYYRDTVAVNRPVVYDKISGEISRTRVIP